jgi:hypothetical protein
VKTLLVGLVAAWTGAASIAARGEPRVATEPPPTLAETGLYSDCAARAIAPDVLAFEPQYPLWTDGAAKSRWIRLPPGTWVDASDPDHFVFPVGTRLWKEFALERAVETRMTWLAEDGWHFATYAWSADGKEARLAPAEGVKHAAESAPGVPYDIPSTADCRACHAASAKHVLGFDALQLSDDRDPLAPHARTPAADALALRELAERGLVRGLPRRLLETPPRIEAATPRERAALGYLSSNCGTCHTGDGQLASLELDLSYSLAHGAGAVATAVERASRFRWPTDCDPQRIDVDAPKASVLLRRMASRQPLSQMPPLGTRVRDTEALELVTDWIREDLAATHRVPPTSPSLPPFSSNQP